MDDTKVDLSHFEGGPHSSSAQSATVSSEPVEQTVDQDTTMLEDIPVGDDGPYVHSVELSRTSASRNVPRFDRSVFFN